MKTKTKKRKSLARIKKLSTLLALGLKDLRKQERAKNSEVCMSTWVYKRNDGRCLACLAGSVMRWSLPLKLYSGMAFPIQFDIATAKRLDALDNLRSGNVGTAAFNLGRVTEVNDRYVPHYDHDRDGWWDAMFQLLGELKAAGE